VKLSRPLPSSPTSLQLRMLARLRHPISPSEKSIRPRSAYSNVHVNPTYALPEFTRRGSPFRTGRENIASPQIGIFRSLGGSHTTRERRRASEEGWDLLPLLHGSADSGLEADGMRVVFDGKMDLGPRLGGYRSSNSLGILLRSRAGACL
jgi:hypothetical protein